MKFNIACVLALTVWGTQTSAAIMDRCASPSEEEFAQLPPSNAVVQDFASELKAKAAPIIAASVAKEEKIAREKRATAQAERERLQAERKRERAAAEARRREEWEASRPEREARAREEKRERERQRELNRQEAERKRKNLELLLGTIGEAARTIGEARSGGQGGSSVGNSGSSGSKCQRCIAIYEESYSPARAREICSFRTYCGTERP